MEADWMYLETARKIPTFGLNTFDLMVSLSLKVTRSTKEN